MTAATTQLPTSPRLVATAPDELDFGRLTMPGSTRPGFAYRGRCRHVERLDAYLSMLLSGGAS